MNNTPDTPTYDTIKRVLDQWKDTELNIGSDAGRQMLAQALHDQIHPMIQDLVENIICPERVVDY
jgi:hypothetical protein